MFKVRYPAPIVELAEVRPPRQQWTKTANRHLRLNTHEQTAVSDYAFACIIFSLSAPNGQTKFRQAFSLLLWQFAFQGGDELRRVGADDGIQTQQEIETIKAAS